MAQAQLPLSKKTKAEILEEYEKVLTQLDDMKTTSQFVHEPVQKTLLEHTKGYTVNTLTQSLSEVKTTVNTIINDLSERLFAQVNIFQELQQAIDLSRKNLELHHHIEIVAETLQNLVHDYEMKKQTFSKEMESQRFLLEEEIQKIKRQWQREQAEYELQRDIERKKEGAKYHEQWEVKEKEFNARLIQLQQQETELQELREFKENNPKELEREIAMHTKEVTHRLEEDHKRLFESAKKDWEAQKKLYEFEIENLKDLIKRQSSEIAILRQEAERANKKSQELAIRVIESNAPLPLQKRAEQQEQKSSAT